MHARGFVMETDVRKIASGGKWGYIGSQPKGKTEIPVEKDERKAVLTAQEAFEKPCRKRGHSIFRIPEGVLIFV